MSYDRYNRILYNEKYKKYVEKNEEWERNRKFCRHDIRHFLDVARIAYIINLELNLRLSKDIIYAAALLHDIGRWKQYKEGIPHEKASAELAEQILIDCGYESSEINSILSAIENHRKDSIRENSLEGLLYRSDKLSRSCYSCKVLEECNWSMEKKNLAIRY